MEETKMADSTSRSLASVMDRVRSTATAQLSTQKNRATDGLGSIAHAVRQTTQPLRENQQDTIAQYVDKAADGIERLAVQLRDKDVSELVADVERFAKRQPAVFIGTTFAIGLLAARFLKSTREHSADSVRNDVRSSIPPFTDLSVAPGSATPGTMPHSIGGV